MPRRAYRKLQCGYCKQTFVYTSKYRHDREKHPGKNPYWIEIEDINQKPISKLFQPPNSRVSGSLPANQSSIEDHIRQSENPSSSHEPSSESPHFSDQPRELRQHRPASICTIDLDVETPHEVCLKNSSTATKQPEQNTIVTGAFSTIPVSSVII